MKKTTCILIFILSIATQITTSQTNPVGFAKRAGGTAYDYGNAIATDNSGNVFTTGLFQGTVDFDPGTSVFNLISLGGGDAFISKLDANGNFLWARQIGGLAGERGLAITTDNSGNVYVAGYFEGAVDFDPSVLGITLLTTLGDPDIFVCKFDASGNYVWAKQMGGSGYDYAFSIAVDGAGNVYTTGKFQATADFNPGLLINSLTSNSGSEDAFISCLNASGDYVWAKKIGGSLYDNANAVAIASNGDLLVSGYFQGTVDFDPGAATVNLTSAGARDAFVLRLSNTGNYVWAKQFGGTQSDESNALAIDGSGNIYITGYYQGTADVDPSAAVYNLTSAGGYDVFTVMLTSAGNFSWSASVGGTGNDEANSIIVSTAKEIYISGYFNGTANFNPAGISSSLTSYGGSDIFICSYNASGGLNWGRQMGGTSDDEAASICLSGDYLHLTGYFNGTADFNPNEEVLNLTSAGGYDIFIEKLNPLFLPLPIELIEFDLKQINKKVNLQWATITETNNRYFTIERSQDGLVWESLMNVAGAENSSTMKEYSASDENPHEGISYYRLKQVDINGMYSYGPIKDIVFEKKENAILVYPNPAREQVFISVPLENTDITTTVYSSTGKLLLQLNSNKNEQQLDLKGLTPGTYTVLVNAGEITEVKHLMVQ